MEEYENDRWRIISAKVGSGFSAAACREKAAEIEVEADVEETEEPEEGYEQEQGEDAGSPEGTTIPVQ